MITGGPASGDDHAWPPAGPRCGWFNVKIKHRIRRQQRQPDRPPHRLPALAGRLGRDAARMHDAQVGPIDRRGRQATGAEVSGELLALVMIDLAAECLDAERFHAKMDSDAYDLVVRRVS